MIDLKTVRADTPTADQYIHLNNAGSSLPPRPVTEAVLGYLRQEAELGGYELAAARAEEIAGFYPAVARLVGAQAHQIAFTTSATDSYNRALSSIPLRAGDYIVTTENDYVSNQIAFLQLQRHDGVRVVRARESEAGGVDVDDLLAQVDRYQPRLVAVTHVPSTSGLIQPVAEIGQQLRDRDCWYLVDACQSAGQLPLDVQAIGCDFLSATFRKFLRGPRGSGFLYASDRVLAEGLEPRFLDLHSAEWPSPDDYRPLADARRFELWERNYALVLGARHAADYATRIGLDHIAARNRQLASSLRDQLRTIPNLQVMDHGPDLCAIVTCYLPGHDPAKLVQQLRDHQIHTSFGTIANARLDLERKAAPWVLRLSPHYYNMEEELESVIKALAGF